MKISKKLTLGCFVLGFALLFGGCWFFGSKQEPAANNSTVKENSADELETKKKEINANVSNANAQVEDFKEKRRNAARKILKIDAEKSIKDSDITNAEKVCKEAEKKSTDCEILETTKTGLETARSNLEQAKTQSNQMPTPSKSKEKTDDSQKNDDNGLWTALLWLVAGLLSLAIIGGVGVLAYRFFAKTINQEREATEQGFRTAKTRHQELAQRIEKLEQIAKAQGNQFPQIQSSLQALQRQIIELGGRDVQQQAVFTPPVYKPEPQFPAAAEDYRNKIRHNAQTATADLIGGRLIADENKGNEFLIVRDGELSDGQFYAVPNQIRFSAKSDYLSYYQNYYHCENPSSGAIWIKSPAIVRRVENGWTLEKTGELEVR